MDQKRSRDLPRPVGADGTTLVSNGRFYEAGPNLDTMEASLALKANIASPTFTGTVTLPAVTQSGTITANSVAITPTELGYIGTLTSDAQTQISAKANAANPVFTGTVTIPDAALAIADTSGLQTALDGKVADTGDTMTGLLRITKNADPSFVVERETGNDVIRVHSAGAPGAVFVVNGALMAGYSDHDATQTWNLDASDGSVFAAGELEVDGALNHDGTTVGFYGATPVTQPAANADTSGATLPNLEIEVNQIKALLRSVGLLAP